MNGEVLCEDEDETTVDRTTTCYDTVAKELLLLHAEVMATVLLEHVVLFERTFVEQHVDTLAGSVFATFMLFLNCFFTTTETSLLTLLDQLLDFF